VSERRNKTAPIPQTFISKDKVVTVNRCGPIETYTEVCKKSDKVATTAYVKPTPESHQLRVRDFSRLNAFSRSFRMRFVGAIRPLSES
jgi:hypothetical protein